jgi:signal transduction histidine kinase
MALVKTKFSRKLHAAFGTMLVITLALAWYFYDSVKWYQHDVQRIAMSNSVLQGFQEVSVLTFRELNQLGEEVLLGEAIDSSRKQVRDQTLRSAVSRVRQGIAAEVAFDGNISNSQDLVSLVDIERVVEEIIRSGGVIHVAMAQNRNTDASEELSRLRSTGVAGHFNSLIESVIAEQMVEVREAGEESISLASYITGVLPIFMSIMVIGTLVVIFVFSRRLKNSVGTLHEGVRAFTGGNLTHRMPPQSEREFWRLGEAFNTMAKELSDHRTKLHDANITLEATVDERTRALKSSNRKLADVDVTRRKLLADISHEFRTPLTVIRGEAEIALRGKNQTKKEHRDSFQRIMDQADHTTRLVDDLLFIARVDAGEPKLSLRSVAIAGMIEQVCTEFAVRAEQEKIDINQEIEETRAIVHGDAGRLRQVFAILIDNALRYSNEGDRIDVSLVHEDKEVRICFQDQGIGLTEDEAEQAFERFYRGSKAEQHARGTGLGLPVAKAIVEAHGGTISLGGKLGEGALATVILPAENRLRVVA